MNIDYFDYIGYLKNKNYLNSCPGLNSLLLVDSPSIDEIILELRRASGDEVTKRGFYSLLESKNVVLPTQVSGTDLRSKVAHLKVRDDADKKKPLSFLDFLVSRDMVLIHGTGWCLTVPKSEAMAAVDASLTKRGRPAMHPADFDLEMRNANVVVLDRFEKAFGKVGRAAITDRLDEIRIALNAAKSSIQFVKTLDRNVIAGKHGHVCEDEIDPSVVRLFVTCASQRQFSSIKKQLRFMRLIKDDRTNGKFCLPRSFAPDEADTIRKVVGLPKRRDLSQERKEALKQQISGVRSKRRGTSDETASEAPCFISERPPETPIFVRTP